MTIQDFMDKWFDEGTSEYTEAEEELRRIRLETRAAVLAEEDRRVWCEAYATERNGGWSDDIATKWADGKLGLYREARAAWDARGEG
jgi:hypothetical protein